MKSLLETSSLKSRFDHASQVVEARFGDKPVWIKLVVFVPVLIILTAILVLLVDGLGMGLLAITRLIQHH
jgi:uncharacterized protein (DUF983 family)